MEKTVPTNQLSSLNISLPPHIIAALEKSVSLGHYASMSEAVAAVLDDWLQIYSKTGDSFTSLQDDINLGLHDLAAGRVKDFEIEAIIAKGKVITPTNHD